MTDWSKYAPASTPSDPTNDDAEFERGLGELSAPQPQPGPQLSDDEEFNRGIGQSAASTKQGMTDWPKYPDAPPDDTGAGSGVDWSKHADASPAKPTAQDYAAMPWSRWSRKASTTSFRAPGARSSPFLRRSTITRTREEPSVRLYRAPASKAESLFNQQDPAQKAQTEAALNTLIAPYTSVAGLKKALAEDPFSVLTTAAIPFSGGAAGFGRAAEALGDVSMAGRAARARARRRLPRYELAFASRRMTSL